MLKFKFMFYQVLKQAKQAAQGAQPELFIVEAGELDHFLHEQSSNDFVLVFSEIPSRNLYLLSKDDD